MSPKISVFPQTQFAPSNGAPQQQGEPRSTVSSPEAVQALRQTELFEREIRERREARFRQDEENQNFQRITASGGAAQSGQRAPGAVGPPDPSAAGVFGLSSVEIQNLLAKMSPQAQTLAVNRLAENKRNQVLTKTRGTMSTRMSGLIDGGFFESNEVPIAENLRDLLSDAETFADLQEVERAFRPVFERARGRRIGVSRSKLVQREFDASEGDPVKREALGFLSESAMIHTDMSEREFHRMMSEIRNPSSMMNWEKFAMDAQKDPYYSRERTAAQYDANVAEFGWPRRDDALVEQVGEAQQPQGFGAAPPQGTGRGVASFTDVEGLGKALKTLRSGKVTTGSIKQAMKDAGLELTEENVIALRSALKGQ